MANSYAEPIIPLKINAATLNNGPWLNEINMKTFCFFSLVILLAFRSQSQIVFGFSAGPQTTSARYTIQNVKQSTDSKYGFHAGVNSKIFFDNQLFFSPAISYSLTGFKVSFDRPSYPPDLLAKDNNTTLHQVDVDLLLQYDFSKKPSHFFVKAGPSLGYIFMGREHFSLLTGEKVDRSMKFGITSMYGSYLGSLVGDCGYETKKGFFIYAHYIHGLTNMSNADGGPQIINRNIGLTLGFYLKYGKLYPGK
jgi:hypothetical protein